MSEDFVYSQSLSTFRQVLFKMFLIMSHNFVNVYYILDGMHISVSVCVYIHIYLYIYSRYQTKSIINTMQYLCECSVVFNSL